MLGSMAGIGKMVVLGVVECEEFVISSFCTVMRVKAAVTGIGNWVNGLKNWSR